MIDPDDAVREPPGSAMASQRGRRLMPISLILAALLAHPASAQDGSRLLDCRIVSLCRPDGTCQSFSGHEPIELTPQDKDEAGRYRIFYGDVYTTAQALTSDGPFLWTERGKDRQTLILTGPETAVWISVDPEPAFSRTLFLACGDS